MLLFLRRRRRGNKIAMAVAAKNSSITVDDGQGSLKPNYLPYEDHTAPPSYTYEHAIEQPQELESGQVLHPQELPCNQADPIELPVRTPTN